MPYSAELSRTSPSCFLFLIDQSSSMAEAIAGPAGRSKAITVADSVNRLIQNLVLKCAKADGVRDYFHVGVIGYGGRVSWAWSGTLAGQRLLPLSVLAQQPLRVEQRTRKVSDGVGGLVEQSVKFPVWFDSTAMGRTPMCGALRLAVEALTEFVGRFPRSYPPIVINISDGRATDGDPEAEATRLATLATADGGVLVFNALLSSGSAQPVEFPSRETDLPDADARRLFRMSSVLPARLWEAARQEGYAVLPEARGFVYNADLVAIVRFLDIGTRVTQALK